MAMPIRRKPVPSSLLSLSENERHETSLNPQPPELLPETSPGVSIPRDSPLSRGGVNETLQANPGPSISTSQDPQHSATKAPHNNVYTWRPFILRRRILVAYIIVFVILFSVIETLYQVSQAHQGIATTENGKYYLWTYGPTAGRLS
jgi:hypothetical protein